MELGVQLSKLRIDNQDLYLRYGFVEHNNPNDRLRVELGFEGLPELSERMGEEVELKRRILLSGPSMSLDEVELYADRFSSNLHALLRVLSR